MSRAAIVPLGFNPVPSLGRAAAVPLPVTDTVPADADVPGIGVGTAREPPEMPGLTGGLPWAHLDIAGVAQADASSHVGRPWKWGARRGGRSVPGRRLIGIPFGLGS